MNAGRSAVDAARTTGVADPRPLIAHVVYRFDVGGLENGLVNLLNRMPREHYRHAVIALTDATDFRARVIRDDVPFIELHKAPGHAARLYPALARMFARMRPAIVHTRNLAALEASVPAWLARVPVRIHGEHGRDIGDLDGASRKYRLVRRAYRPFVDHYVAVSGDLTHYLVDDIGIPATRVTRIVNGVDTRTFRPRIDAARVPGCPFADPQLVLVGTVGRLQAVKNQVLLARAFAHAVAASPALRARLRLVIVGDGPMRSKISGVLAAAGVADLAWLPGMRGDVADLLRSLDLFVLPSQAEGISNTILEAMATGLPVIATDVGGNAELIEDGVTGSLVPSADVGALAAAIARHAQSPALARTMGHAGRARAERLYGLETMVAQYSALYDRLLARRRRANGREASGPAARATTGSD
jgi:sugar transferase (PEP-CTERM/EpsH1 system associated)